MQGNTQRLTTAWLQLADTHSPSTVFWDGEGEREGEGERRGNKWTKSEIDARAKRQDRLTHCRANVEKRGEREEEEGVKG